MPIPYALVAEDEVICRMDVADVLTQAGYQVLEAGGSDEAMGLLSEHHASVILMLTDVDMPGSMNGLALAHKVHENWAHIDIVVCSGRHQPKDGELPPPAVFLGKPIDRMSLLELAQKVVKTPRPGVTPL
ncbi:response regulator [Methylopila sp. Yamaguchi]|uniref:response regulator n=1 Tax=Methylopila sp. Yamaguchi TaxID=1437817 RepID=UPI000CC40D63|nr:response regulator [Methylopila sp. Yamaguchi]GBD48124.1 response regulator receiver [Methylopila sp. Yamaguchi]